MYATQPQNEELGFVLDRMIEDALTRSEPWRMQGREAHDFYNHVQWTEEQRNALLAEERPCTTINQIAKAIDNILGREAASRFDWMLVPREGGDVNKAAEMTRGLAYIADLSGVDIAISDAFADAAKGPMGWLEVSYDDSDPTAEPISVRNVYWDDMFFDPYGRNLDLSDFRYVGRRKTCDLDAAVARLAHVPGAAEVMARRAFTGERPYASYTETQTRDYGNALGGPRVKGKTGVFELSDAMRYRVELKEIWWQQTEPCDVYVLPNGMVWNWDPNDPKIQMCIMQGVGMRFGGSKKCFYYAILCDEVVLHQDKSPYPWARFPFVAVWCKRDKEGRPYGLVEGMKDPQRELNTARSRFNESIRSRWVIYGKGNLSPTEIAEGKKMIGRPNFMWGVQNPAAVQIGNDKPDGQFWLQLMETSRAEIDDVIGQNEAAYGDKSNERTGEAIKQRVMQQSQNLGRLWDNLRLARKLVGEMLLGLMIKFYTPEKLGRVLEVSALRDKGEADLGWLDLKSSPAMMMQLGFDVILVDQSETASERQQSMAQWIEMMKFVPPEMTMMLVADGIRMSDWPGKEQMAKKVEMFVQMMMQPQQQPMPGQPPGGAPSAQFPQPAPQQPQMAA